VHAASYPARRHHGSGAPARGSPRSDTVTLCRRCRLSVADFPHAAVGNQSVRRVRGSDRNGGHRTWRGMPPRRELTRYPNVWTAGGGSGCLRALRPPHYVASAGPSGPRLDSGRTPVRRCHLSTAASSGVAARHENLGRLRLLRRPPRHLVAEPWSAPEGRRRHRRSPLVDRRLNPLP